MATRLNVIGSDRIPISYPPKASYRANLTSSIIPTASVGAITCTRASVATVTNNNGFVTKVKSGEARFEGARRVENLATYSQDLTNVIWTKSNTTIGAYTDTVDGLPTFTLTDDAINASHSVRYNLAHTINRMYCVSAYVKAGTASACQITVASVSTEYANFDLSNGTITAGNTSQATIVSKGNGWYRISLYYTAISTSAQLAGVFMITSPSSARAQQYVGSSSTIRVTGLQIENISGQSILAPAEYVSTNVLSSPFHGAMVDGVKYFDTDIAGARIPEATLKGIAIEGARTNLFLQSEDLTTTWAPQGLLTVSANQAVAPDGSLTADKIIPNSVSAFQVISQSVTVTAAVHSISFFAKAGERGYIQALTAGAMSNGYINFDLINGTVGASSLFTGSIEALPNGWYKCSVITDTLAAGTNLVHFNPVSSAATGRAGNIAGDNVGGLYLWGMQIELGAFPSSYIPTTTATVARPTDVLSYNLANVISNTGAVYLEYTMGYVPSVGVDRRVLGITGNTNNRFQITATSVTTNTTLLNVGNGAAVLSTNLGVVMATNGFSKVAGKWTNSGVANLFQNGNKSSDIASPQVTATQIDVGTGGGSPLYGFVKNLRIWKSPPTDTELLAITTL